MADNKHYITQSQENGNVMISDQVLVNIIFHAVGEVEDVSLSGKPGINWGKGIKVIISEDDKVAVKVYINVNYNHSVTTAAAAVQESIRTALESMTGVEVSSVNVEIVGISRQ